MKDPEDADVHYTFMSEDGREIDFDGEEGIKQWIRIGGDKKISRQTPNRTYQVMGLVDREKRKYKMKVARLLRIQLEEQSRPYNERNPKDQMSKAYECADIHKNILGENLDRETLACWASSLKKKILDK